jgi:hypothetical protein
MSKLSRDMDKAIKSHDWQSMCEIQINGSTRMEEFFRCSRCNAFKSAGRGEMFSHSAVERCPRS